MVVLRQLRSNPVLHQDDFRPCHLFRRLRQV
jgi:hypothetical protein